MLKQIFKPYWRESLGICIIVFGSPVIFFLRDTLKLAPKSSVFTAAFLVLGIFLMITPSVLRKMYKPNFTLLKLGTGFLALSLFYLFFHNPFAETQWYDPFREISNFVFIFLFLFMLINLPNDIRDTLVEMIAWVTFVGSIALIISLFLNPNYVLGQRATIYFGDGEEGGNPHVFAKNGFAQFVVALIMFKNSKLIGRLFYGLSAFIAVVVIIITQTRAILLALFLIMAIFMYFNLSKKQIKHFIQSTFTIKNLLIIAVVLFAFYYYLVLYTPVFQILSSYTARFTDTFGNMLFTVLGLKETVDTQQVVDPSAQQRVMSFALFKNYWYGIPEKLVLGLGYRSTYLDIPVLEAFLDCGYLGFILFSGFNLIIVKDCYKAMKYKYNDLTTFLAYFYVSFFIGIFSAGRPFDTPYWFFFAVLIRFLGIKYLERDKA
jgi:hypothetical protein